MTSYTVTFTVQRATGPHTITTTVGGCLDEADAERKIRAYYDGVLKIRKVVPKEGPPPTRRPRSEPARVVVGQPVVHEGGVGVEQGGEERE